MVQLSKVLDGIVFALLFSAAIGFIYQSLVQYQSKDTSFKRAEIPVKSEDIPTFTFCLIPEGGFEWGPPYPFILGRDFNISYEMITDENKYLMNISTQGILSSSESKAGIQFNSIQSKTLIIDKINDEILNCMPVQRNL